MVFFDHVDENLPEAQLRIPRMLAWLRQSPRLPDISQEEQEERPSAKKNVYDQSHNLLKTPETIHILLAVIAQQGWRGG